MRTAALVVPLLFVLLGGCDQLGGAKKDSGEESDDEPRKKKKKKTDEGGAASASAAASAPATASASASASAKPSGPVLSIPAGPLKIGAACGAVPRVTNEELVHPSVSMTEFTIDAYPYPNEPGVKPKTGVTRAEAESLCQQAGKRLCTELEWERACKGEDNKTFEYAGTYDKAACAAGEGLTGKRDKCKSAFGVYDLHGLALEWTASSWGRGQGSGLATTRGHHGSGNVVRERCASGQGRDPEKSFQDVGFRCCGGPQNPAVVDLTLLRQPVLTEDARVDATLARDLLNAMPKDHQELADATVRFDRVWRWHPRDNEELIVARWVGNPTRGSSFAEIAVFKVCGGVPTRVTRIRGPVEKADRLREDGSPERLVFDVSTEKDRGQVKLAYWYGSVAVTQPDWIKEGNRLVPKDPRKKLFDAVRPKKK